MRNATDDFVEIVQENRSCFSDGVVHSFTGNWEDARKILGLDLWIGLNGCSMKSQETIDAIRNIPIDRIMVESDAPWCEIRRSHAGYPFIKTHFTTIAKEKYNDCADYTVMVKSRNEPSAILYKLQISEY
jgi:TatD DNase family protein